MHMGIDAWIGLGRYYALLCDRFPDAVAFVAPRLESDRPNPSITSIAFWSGYLWAPSVSSDALTRLRDAYRLHARALQKEGVLEADLRDVFCQHIVIGVLREIPGFGDILCDTLGDDFDPVSRGAIASALGRGIAEAAENPETLSHSLATEQFREYWAAHVEQIGGRDGSQLAQYLGWLGEAQLPPAAIAHLIEASLDQAEGGSGARRVFEYLSRYVEEDPAGVLRLLRACVESWRLHGYFWLDREEVHDVLERLIPESSDEAVFREVVDAFAEFGAVSAADARRYRASRPSDEIDDAQSQDPVR